jgi:hypothetical protein
MKRSRKAESPQSAIRAYALIANQLVIVDDNARRRVVAIIPDIG